MTKALNTIAAACGVAVLFATSPATAHAALVGASPAADATVASPATIQLKFSEVIEPKFSGLELTKDGKTIALAPVAFDAKNKKAMNASPQAPLVPGVYMVAWHAVADDLHKSEGAFSFTVK